MAANTAPIFPLTPNCGTPGALLSAAATAAAAFDGTMAAGTAMQLIFTAGANGSRVDSVRVRYSGIAGTAPSGTSTATVVRIFLNNGASNTTATNNILVADMAVAAQLYSNTASLPEYLNLLNISIPASWRVYALNTTAVGGSNCALAVSASGGDY